MRGDRCSRVTRIGLCALLGAACGEASDGTAGSASAGGTSTGASGEATSAAQATEGDSTTSDGSGSAGMTQGSTGAPDPGSGSTAGDGSTGGTAGDEGTTSMGIDSTTDASSTTDKPAEPPLDQACMLAQKHKPCDADSMDPLHALGLNCTTLGGEYVNNDNAVTVQGLNFQAPPMSMGKRTWQVATAYGTHVDPDTNQPFWSAREGEKVLLLSSGLLPAPDGAGKVVVADGDVYNDAAIGGPWDDDSMPAPMSPTKGSPDPMGFTGCDGANDCSNTLEDQWALGNGDAEDKTWFSFELKAPSTQNGDIANANGYTFDFAYFSAEFPEWVDTDFNDIFVVWQSSEMYTGNVTFIDGQPLTVTALWPIDFQGECSFGDPGCVGADPHLAGTGYSSDGGATGWYKATSGVTPGETFTLAFAIFDMGDSIYDTTAILDNWKWDCDGCVPNEVDSCGIEPQ